MARARRIKVRIKLVLRFCGQVSDEKLLRKRENFNQSNFQFLYLQSTFQTLRKR